MKINVLLSVTKFSIPSSLSLSSLSSCKKKTFFPKQFPSVTICPGRNNRPDHWAFIESLYSVVDPGSPSVKEIFGFIPHAVLRHRFEVNLQSLEAEEDEEFLEVMLKETFEQISLFPEHQPSENEVYRKIWMQDFFRVKWLDPILTNKVERWSCPRLRLAAIAC